MDIFEIIEKERKARKVKKDDLAKLLNLAPRTFWRRYEKKDLTLGEVKKILKLFGLAILVVDNDQINAAASN